MSGERLDQASMEDFRNMAAALVRVEALADEWADVPTGGECPDGLCGACTLGVAAQRLTAALAHPSTDPDG